MIERISTRDMSREEWLSRRQQSIGGSDAGALLGLNPYSSPYALWAEKTGAVVPEDISEKEAVRLGNDLEQYVSERFTEATGKRLRRDNAIIYNSEYPFAHANIDRSVVGEPDAGFEAKTTSSFAVLEKCRNGTYPDTWLCQMTHYMMVTGAKRWYLGVLCFGHGFFHFVLERDDAEVAALAKAEADFWQMVETKTPPAVDGAQATTEALKVILKDGDGTGCDLSPLSGELRLLSATKKQIKELQQIADEQQNRIVSYMGASERGEYDTFRVSFKPQVRQTFDTKRFRADHPMLDLSGYMKTTATRPFKLTEVI